MAYLCWVNKLHVFYPNEDWSWYASHCRVEPICDAIFICFPMRREKSDEIYQMHQMRSMRQFEATFPIADHFIASVVHSEKKNNTFDRVVNELHLQWEPHIKKSHRLEHAKTIMIITTDKCMFWSQCKHLLKRLAIQCVRLIIDKRKGNSLVSFYLTFMTLSLFGEPTLI